MYMKSLFLVVAITCLTTPIFAQTNTFSSAEDPDPATKAILDKVRKKYDSYKSLAASFQLDIEFPEQPIESQKGSIARQGDQYKIDIGSQTVISDGNAIWLILHNNKEVQINDVPDVEEDGALLSPEAIFTFYDQGKFAYYLTNQPTENGKVLQQIEFKPLDRNTEYSKLRLTVEKKTSKVVRIKAFSKDGSRYTFRIANLNPNKTFAANHFTFNKADYPGYYIEDLRE